MADNEALTAATRELAHGLMSVHGVLTHLVEMIEDMRAELYELRQRQPVANP